MRGFASLFFTALVLFGCQQQKVKEERYLNMDSLVNAQVHYLSHSNLFLKKEASIGNKKSASTNKLDSTGWSNELDVFRQLDLVNRPIYREVYLVKDGVKDSKSNLLIRSYEAPVNSPIPYVRLFYQDTPNRLKKLEAFYQENNSLYGSKRKMEMYFDDASGKTYLKGYLMEGQQKMMLSDSVKYTIKAEVVLTEH